MNSASKWLWLLSLSALLCAQPAAGQRAPATKPPPRSAAGTTKAPAKSTSPTPPLARRANPLLPPAIPIEAFFIDLSLVQKAAATPPAGFEALYAPEDWSAFRQQFGAQADDLPRQKASGQIAFAEKLITAAAAAGSPSEVSPGLRRLLLLRAAAIAYRNREGFPTADKAVSAYLALLDKKSATQLGALWTIANQISRMSVTPKPDRIRFDALAARANMQLALLLLDADQVDAAQNITRQIAYHEGWLKSDPETRAKIAQVRAHVKQTAAMMDYLAAQYQPALQNDEPALLAIYLYGRYVKGQPAIVADLPGRLPASRLSQLATTLESAEHGEVTESFGAAEQLRAIAAIVPDAVIRQRTLYAALKLYDAFLASPKTERDRIHRTLALMAREGVLADGARKGITLDPFAIAAAQ